MKYGVWALCVLLVCRVTAIAQEVNLTPWYETGQRFALHHTDTTEINQMGIQGFQAPANGFDTFELRGEIRVLDAVDGKLNRVEMFYELAENRSQVVGANRPQTTRNPLQGKTITISRLPGAETDPTRWSVDVAGITLTPTQIATVRDRFARSLFPNQAIPPGQRIEIRNVDLLLNRDWKGSTVLQYIRGERGGDGRPVAIVEVRLNAQLDKPAAGQTPDTLMSNSLGGSMRVDFETRQIVGLDLQGDWTMEVGGAQGQPLFYYGRRTITSRLVIMPKAERPPTPPVRQEDPPRPPPQPPRNDQPPQPPRNDQPPQPPRNDQPPQPPRNDQPPQPPRNDQPPQPPRNDQPPQPPRNDQPPRPPTDNNAQPNQEDDYIIVGGRRIPKPRTETPNNPPNNQPNQPNQPNNPNPPRNGTPPAGGGGGGGGGGGTNEPRPHQPAASGQFSDLYGRFEINLPRGWTVDPLDENGKSRVGFTHETGVRAHITWYVDIPAGVVPRVVYEQAIQGLYKDLQPTWSAGQASQFLGNEAWSGEADVDGGKIVVYTTVINSFAPTLLVYGKAHGIAAMQREIDELRAAFRITTRDGAPTRQPPQGQAPAQPGNRPSPPYQPGDPTGLRPFLR